MFIPILQIIVSIAIVTLILLQERGGGMSGIFGGGGDSGGMLYNTRRGFEKFVFWGTIILSVVFVALAVVSLFS